MFSRPIGWKERLFLAIVPQAVLIFFLSGEQKLTKSPLQNGRQEIDGSPIHAAGHAAETNLVLSSGVSVCHFCRVPGRQLLRKYQEMGILLPRIQEIPSEIHSNRQEAGGEVMIAESWCLPFLQGIMTRSLCL